MSKVMEPNMPVALAIDAGSIQYLVKGTAQCGDRIPAAAWAGEKWRTGKTVPKLLNDERSAVNESLGQVGRKRYLARLIELGMTDM